MAEILEQKVRAQPTDDDNIGLNGRVLHWKKLYVWGDPGRV